MNLLHVPHHVAWSFLNSTSSAANSLSNFLSSILFKFTRHPFFVVSDFRFSALLFLLHIFLHTFSIQHQPPISAHFLLFTFFAIYLINNIFVVIYCISQFLYLLALFLFKFCVILPATFFSIEMLVCFFFNQIDT